MATAAVACTGSSPGASSGTLPDGGPLPDGGGFVDSGNGSVPCPPAPTVLLEAMARSIALVGDEIVFVDHAAGTAFLSGKTRGIRKIKVDGTGDMVLYAAATLHQINDMRVSGSTIFFLESERNEFGSDSTRIFSMPVSGGLHSGLRASAAARSDRSARDR